MTPPDLFYRHADVSALCSAGQGDDRATVSHASRVRPDGPSCWSAAEREASIAVKR
ncbi:hypothetical protein HCU64_08995 [Methylobacterium sp. C25]|uniref:hypothetical protein n=1 Tax=Methylobacterium sp. C25 TaxID=2721622 RepID=UPI001F20C1CA|nr:hypothetical protein [Methylobacterium sp. C25]MCE4223885.1 hypothetical protein [Methylobacterium sp. C25]